MLPSLDDIVDADGMYCWILFTLKTIGMRY